MYYLFLEILGTHLMSIKTFETSSKKLHVACYLSEYLNPLFSCKLQLMQRSVHVMLWVWGWRDDTSAHLTLLLILLGGGHLSDIMKHSTQHFNIISSILLITSRLTSAQLPSTHFFVLCFNSMWWFLLFIKPMCLICLVGRPTVVDHVSLCQR